MYEECGTRTRTGRVYLGNQTQRSDYPWMVMMHIDGDTDDPQCGATLLPGEVEGSSRYVITAAHCIP